MENSSIIQIRINPSLKIRATKICENLGMDLSTYIRLCLKKLTVSDGLPFELILTEKEKAKLELLSVWDEIKEQNQNSNPISEKEIEEEIHAYREEKKHKSC